MEKTYDAIVIGLGAMGSASLYQLALSGLDVLGIDQFSPPHRLGSTHGTTRVMRQAIGEGAHYSPLALRSYELFREIEKKTNESLLQITGMLIISNVDKSVIETESEFFENTVLAAQKYGIKHAVLNAREVRERFPQFKIGADEKGYFEHGAGYLRPEEIVRLQLLLAAQSGATVHEREMFKHFEDNGKEVIVATDQAVYRSKRLVVAAGSWLPNFVTSDLRQLLKVYRQTQVWFDVSDNFTDFAPGKFPIFFRQLPGVDRWIYGFPAIEGKSDGLQVSAPDSPETVSADAVDRNVSQEQIDTVYKDYVSSTLEGVGPEPVKVSTCLITCSPDSEFIIDTHPHSEKVIICSPCSGHGFKHSAAIGECIAQLVAEGESKIDLSPFKADRLTNVALRSPA